MVAGGTASRVALAAAGLGRTVQLVGKTGDDPTADGVVLDLARGGVGHVALLRDSARATPLEAITTRRDRRTPSPRTTRTDGGASPPPTPPGPALEAADVELGLRYLTDFAVVVLAEPADPATIAVVADATRWGEARMVLVRRRPGRRSRTACPATSSSSRPRRPIPDGAFADLVGAFAAALDEGTEPGAAFRSSIASDGWTEAGGA